jgi:aspartate kinase
LWCCRIWERDLIAEELEGLMQDFEGVAKAHYRRGMAIISLICNVQRTSEILERTFRVLNRENIRVQMMSQGASKTNIALIVEDSEAKHALRVLHAEFFGAEPQR